MIVFLCLFLLNVVDANSISEELPLVGKRYVESNCTDCIMFSKEEMIKNENYLKKEFCYKLVCRNSSIEDLKRLGFTESKKDDFSKTIFHQKKKIIYKVQFLNKRVFHVRLNFLGEEWNFDDMNNYLKTLDVSRLKEVDEKTLGNSIGCFSGLSPMGSKVFSNVDGERIIGITLWHETFEQYPSQNDMCG